MSFVRTVKFRLIGLGIVLIVVGVLVRQFVMLPAVRDRVHEVVADAQLSIAALVARDLAHNLQMRRTLIGELAATIRPALVREPAHVRMHEALTVKAEALIADFHRGSADFGALFTFLAHDMVARHIVSQGHAYFPYLGAAVSDRLPA